jgi:LuxR family maltose regulon positive regulatory protein
MAVRLKLAQGDVRGARQALDQAQQRVQVGGIPPATAGRVAAVALLCALSQDDLPAAQLAAATLDEGIDCHSFYRFLGLTKARLLLAQKPGSRGAAATLAGLEERAAQSGWQYGLIAVRVLRSLAERTADASLDHLAAALTSARPQGYVRTFVEVGEALVPLLHEAARRGIETEYVGQILAAIGDKAQAGAASASSLVEPLSAREVEVLRLVTAGLSNREIAAKLFITAGTVKRHVHNLCGKLGARNRTEAATRAKELDLV